MKRKWPAGASILYDTEDAEELAVFYEKRRSSSGRRLGPKPRDDRSYDERQVAPKERQAVVDESGHAIDGP